MPEMPLADVIAALRQELVKANERYVADSNRLVVLRVTDVEVELNVVVSREGGRTQA